MDEYSLFKNIKDSFLVAGLPETEDEDPMTALEGSNETRSDESMTELAARLLLTQILSNEGALCAPPTGHQTVSPDALVAESHV